MNRNHQSLELDKVLELLAAETTCADAAVLARELTPVPYLSQVQRLMEETDAAFRLMAQFGSPSFGQVKNVTNALRRAEAGASLSLREFLDIAETLRVIRSLAEWRAHCAGVETCLDDRFPSSRPINIWKKKSTPPWCRRKKLPTPRPPRYTTSVGKCGRPPPGCGINWTSWCAPPAYQKLLQDPIVTIRGGRFVVPVKAEHRGEVPGLVHDTSASGATVFVEPMGVVEANNELKVLASREEAEIERILAALSAEVGSFASAIAADYRVLVELNLIFAKARLGYKMKAVMPRITDDGHILLRKARHPLIAADKVVPIDVELGGGFDTLVITGPNTGGKTVTLKTLGLLTLMAMCGLMPPVSDGSSLSVFSEVLADIGDEQSIEQSLSTFSAHMTNLIRILGEAGPRSLVLMDELGAGTDPVEGAALAIAILERLRQQGARIASTTHYAELKAYAIHTDGVENGSCEFDVATLRPTYRLLVGVPGRSNAFAISERLGMDKTLVDRARELVSSDNRRLEDVVSNLEERRQALEGELQQARELRARAEQDARQAEQRLAEMDKQREREMDRARSDARGIVDRARSEAEQLIAELDTLRKQKNAAEFALQAQNAKSQLRARLNAVESAVDPVFRKREDGYTLPRALRAGDEVLLVDIDKRATVLGPADAGGNVEVQAGIIRTRVPLSNLRLLEAKKAPSPTKGRAVPAASRGHGVASRAERTVSTELDLRGQTTEEALLEVDRFIDNAVLTGVERVTIIHGKGTGALRAAIQQHLRRHPSVKEFRLGSYGEGETGVTIAELK